MLIKKLRLKNIRTYDDVTMILEPGVTLLEGDIGSGKSSLLMALEFALFGLGDQDARSLLRFGAQEAEVELTLLVESQEVTLHRTLKSKKGKKSTKIEQGLCEIITGGNRHEYSVTEMREQVLSLLQYNENPDPRSKSVIYRYAVFTPQEEMKQIVLQSPDARLNTLRKAMRLEDYKLSGDHAETLRRDLYTRTKQANQLQLNSNDLAKAIKDLEAEIAGITEDIKAKRAEAQTLNAQLKSKQTEEQQLQTDMTLLATLTTEAKNLQQDLRRNETEQKGAEQQKKGLYEKIKDLDRQSEEAARNLQALPTGTRPTALGKAEVQADFEEQQKIAGDITSTTAILEIARRQLAQKRKDLGADAKIALDALTTKKTRVEQRLKALERQDQRLAENLQDLSKQTGEFNSDIKKDSKLLETTRTLSDQCPTCEQKITPARKDTLVRNWETRIRNLKESKTRGEELDKVLKVSQRECKKQQTDLTSKLTQLQSQLTLVKEREELVASVKEAEESLAASVSKTDISEKYPAWKPNIPADKFLQKLLAALNQFEQTEIRRESLTRQQQQLTKSRAENKASIESWNEQLTRMTTEHTLLSQSIKRVAGEIAKLGPVGENFARVKEEIQTLHDKEKVLGTTLGQLEGSKGGKEKLLDDKQTAKSLLDARVEGARQLQDYHAWLTDFFLPALPAIEKAVMSSMHQKFSDHFRRLFHTLVEDPTKETQVDEAFSPLVEQGGYMMDYDALSGGERTSVALAYRLALNQTIHEFATGAEAELLIFDEPTDGFSTEQLAKFRDILTDLHCAQIILVSHQRELEPLADHLIRVRKENGISSLG